MSEIRFFCVLCGTPVKTGREHGGQLFECPKCRRAVPVPPAPGTTSLKWVDMYPPDITAIDIIFPCPVCRARLGSDARTAGTYVWCPPCGSRVQVPHLASLIVSTPSVNDASKNGSIAPIAAAKLTAEEIDFLRNARPEAKADADPPKEKAANHA